jgi:hypothetical protein
VLSNPPQSGSNPGSSLPGSSSHHFKKKAVKHHQPKPAHHKKPVVHVHQTATTHAVKTKVHGNPAVSHGAGTVVTMAVVAAHTPPTHVVDLALEDVHVNLRRSNGKHHG